MRTKIPVNVGDRVRYTADFLRSICCYTGDLPFAKGEVVALHKLSEETILAEIVWDTWDTEDIPKRVNIYNLERCR